ncbi:MAG: DUF899 family protein [Sciscionella sp.]
MTGRRWTDEFRATGTTAAQAARRGPTRSPPACSNTYTRDTSLVEVSRAPLAKIEVYKARKGWTFPWYSSYGSDFNYDFHVTLDDSVTPVEYNYRTKAEHEQAGTSSYVEGEQPMEAPGSSYFLRDGDRVFHTYSTYARGAEMTGGSYYFLDLTTLGRQEDWEEPKGRASGGSPVSPHQERGIRRCAGSQS